MGLKLNTHFGQTLLTEEDKEGLLLKTISTQNELNEWEQLNISKAVEWSLSLSDTQNLITEKFLKTLHKKMYGDVWKWAGEFRKSDKNIGVKWTQISIELKMLLDDFSFWMDHETYSPEEMAIRFKHRIISIHCFPNGNGRHSRLIADILMNTVFKLPYFTWHHSNMVAANEIRKTYILALKAADRGNMEPLLNFAQHK